MEYNNPITSPIMPIMPIHNPIVRINAKGLVFSREAVELIGATPLSRIIIDKEEGDSTNLYVRISDKVGYPVRFQNKRYLVYSRPLARRIMQYLGLQDGESAIFRLGDTQKNYLGESITPIITRINYESRN